MPTWGQRGGIPCRLNPSLRRASLTPSRTATFTTKYNSTAPSKSGRSTSKMESNSDPVNVTGAGYQRHKRPLATAKGDSLSSRASTDWVDGVPLC